MLPLVAPLVLPAAKVLARVRKCDVGLLNAVVGDAAAGDANGDV